MIRLIVHDPLFLGRQSEPATEADRQIMADLLDTLRANLDRCVGMAANMIGARKRVIAVSVGPADVVMYNPVVLRKDSPYEAEESCLSLDGARRTTRYRDIEVEYTDAAWKRRRGRFSGWTAQIIQHEIDHLEGIII